MREKILKSVRLHVTAGDVINFRFQRDYPILLPCLSVSMRAGTDVGDTFHSMSCRFHAALQAVLEIQNIIKMLAVIDLSCDMLKF